MATDATGTPTSPDGLAKINPSVDAPSGVGQNSLADSIQTALTNNYVRKPSGLVSGEVPVWNGTGWDRSSVTNIGPTSLGSGTPAAGKYLDGSGAWTTLPTAALEQAYTQITSDVSVTATTEGTANTIITGASFTADGTSAYLIEFFSPQVITPGGATDRGISLVLLENTTVKLGFWAQILPSASMVERVPVHLQYRYTPAAGSTNFVVKAFVTAGTGTVKAGAGGSGTVAPAFLRVTKVT